MNNKISDYNHLIFKYNWKIKRTALNLFWSLLNLTLLVYITNLLIGSGWEFIWCVGIVIYASVYWILAAMLFDALIGDEFDVNQKLTDHLK